MSEQRTPDPFGFFKPEPCGWTDCTETVELQEAKEVIRALIEGDR